MRLRLLAFIPPATLVTMLLFTLTSSLVSALETSLVVERIQSVDLRRIDSMERLDLEWGRVVDERCDRSAATRIESSAFSPGPCPSRIEEGFSAGRSATPGPATFLF